MKELNYSIKINASAKKVWELMLKKENYKKWVKPFSDDSEYKGKWEQGEKIYFYDDNMNGGTAARLNVVDPYNKILAEHIALIDKQFNEDTTSEEAKKWIGTIENYYYNKIDENTTEFKVVIKTHEDYTQMFEDCWPQALLILKDICEN